MKTCCGGASEENKGKAKEGASGLRRSNLAIPVIVGLIIVGGLYFYSYHTPEKTPRVISMIVPEASGAELTFPQNSFSDNKAHHFDYTTPDGVKVRYFIMKSSDGVIRAAFDACDVCFGERKGYVQKDDVMVCRNCGRRFQSTKINEVTGGCNPAPLTRSMKDNKVIVRSQDLDQGRMYFDARGGAR